MGRYPNTRNWQGIPALLAAIVSLGLSLGLAPAAARAEEAPAMPVWQAVDASTGQLTGVTDLQALVFMFPDSSLVRRRLLTAYLEAERPADALNEAVELVRRGYAFSPGSQEMLLALDSTAEQREVLERQQSMSAPLEASRLLATVPAEVQLIESVWRDPRSGDLFVTSVVSRALHVRRGEGAWEKIPLEAAGSLSGMAFDPASGELWIASGVFDQTPDPATAFRGLIVIDAASGMEKRRLAAPEGGSPSDLGIDAGGNVYASDPFSGAIYVAWLGASRLETLIEPGTFRSPQGIAAFPRSTLIVVSDYAYGLALIDVSTRSIRRVPASGPVLLDGIDGLWLDVDCLTGIQNGVRPMRIVELRLARDRLEVVAAEAVEAAHPVWTEPVGGSISSGELVYVATGQWDRFGDGGALTGDRPPVPTEIRVLPLE